MIGARASPWARRRARASTRGARHRARRAPTWPPTEMPQTRFRAPSYTQH